MAILQLPIRILRAAAKRLLRLGRRTVQLGVAALVAGAILFVLDALLLRDQDGQGA